MCCFRCFRSSGVVPIGMYPARLIQVFSIELYMDDSKSTTRISGISIFRISLQPGYEMTRKSLYDILQLQRNASLDEIKSGFKRRALQVHPDKGGNKDSLKKVIKRRKFHLQLTIHMPHEG